MLVRSVWLIVLLVPLASVAQPEPDPSEVLAVLASWEQGWAEKNVELAVQDYASDVDWTNAFGDRFQGIEALRQGLGHIFSLDFVMAGTSGTNEFEDVTFLDDDTALIRSKLVRKGQLLRSGDPMPDRHVNHLRVLERRDGRWVIVSHLISQAQPKR